MTDAIPAAGPRGVTRTDTGAFQAVQRDSSENLQARLFGEGQQPGPAEYAAFKKAFPDVDPRAPDVQKILQQLQKAGLQLGNPPSIGNAREGMIAALALASGDSRAELEKKSLPELMAMYQGLNPNQQRAGRMQAPGTAPGGSTPADGVDRPGAGRPGARRRATPRGVHPPRPRGQLGVQPRRRMPRQTPVERRRQPVANPVFTAANRALAQIEARPEAAAARAGHTLPDAQRDGLVRDYVAVLRALPADVREQNLRVVPELLRGRVRDTLNPPTP